MFTMGKWLFLADKAIQNYVLCPLHLIGQGRTILANLHDILLQCVHGVSYVLPRYCCTPYVSIVVANSISMQMYRNYRNNIKITTNLNFFYNMLIT